MTGIKHTSSTVSGCDHLLPRLMDTNTQRLGMTTVEHPLPIPHLYDDIITLFALSGTGSSPTHIVNYGGAFGEQYVWATEDIPNDSK